MEEILEIVEIGGDVIIILGAAYIGWLFWRTYRRSNEARSAVLSLIFFVMAAYFAFQVLVVNLLGMEETFGWMESHLALEMMLMLMIIALSITLSVRASWRGVQLKEKSEDKKVA